MSTQQLDRYLQNLQLTRLGEEQPAGLWVCSLPWPRMAQRDLSLGGRATTTLPLGQWYAQQEPMPRRMLMLADGNGEAPQSVTLQRGAAPSGALPNVEMERFWQSPDETFITEQHMLRITGGGKSVGMAMGMRVGDEVHWWEACRLVIIEKSETCITAEMGGAIPLDVYGSEQLRQHPGVTNPYLHKHNWLNGHIYLRAHANGVCEVFAHHINARYVDTGGDLKNAVPVIGFWTDESDADAAALRGVWKGDKKEITVNNVPFDIADVAPLATEDQPGRFDYVDGFLTWQPYEGMELYGGSCPQQRTGDPYIFRAEQKIIPRGMARTLRFSLSLSDRPAHVVRYQAPGWWYGLCEELTPQSLLPVEDAFDQKIDWSRTWAAQHNVEGGFEDGLLARGGGRNQQPSGRVRWEPSWEGDLPYGIFLSAWRTGDAEDYKLAMRASYYFTDVAVDHADKVVRMHGYAPPAISLPMNRVLCCIAAYLETGDQYLIETASSVTDAAYAIHKNSWPRLATGRDACFIRGAVMMYRYFNDDHYRKMAHAACLDVCQTQRPDGAYGDQGGGTGIHQRSSYVVKPWMGTLATCALLDYAELVADDPQIEQAIIRFAQWLYENRYEHHNGVVGWSYQHFYGTSTRHYNVQQERWINLPSDDPWHQESFGRIMGYAAIRTGNGALLDAYMTSYEGAYQRRLERLANAKKKVPEAGGDHGCSAVLQYLVWLQMNLWNATIDGDGEGNGDGICVSPVHFGPRTHLSAKIITPQGPLDVSWDEKGRVQAGPGVRVSQRHLQAEVTAG